MKKTILYSLLVIITLVIAGYIYVNYTVKSKVESFLEKQLSPELQFQYEDLNMSLISGDIVIEKIVIKLKNKTNDDVHTKATINSLELIDFKYWKYFNYDKIEFDRISIDENKVVYYKDKFIGSSSNEDGPKNNPLATVNKSISIKNFEIAKTRFKILDNSNDSIVLNVYNAGLTARNITTDSKQILKRIPLSYKDVTLKTDSIKVKLGTYENLFISSLDLDEKDITINDLSINPRFSRNNFHKNIKVERDYMSLNVPKVLVNNYKFGFENNKFFTTIAKVIVKNPDFKIYRDKSIADDTSSKPLYSEVLRKLPIDMLVDSIQIEKAGILYEEKSKSDKPAGNIKFDKLDIAMNTVGNMQEKGKETNVVVNGLFQGSPLKVNWSFDVHDTSDRFRFNGNLINLQASRINSFTANNLGVGFEGTLQEVYFDISGNSNSSTTKMKMAYDNFKIDVLRKETAGVNKLLSGIANLFVANDSVDKDSKYREGEGHADRNQQKSIFNFIWVSIMSGLIKTIL